MPEYLAPGVFTEELDTGPKPIEGVGTSMAAFVGFTEKVPQEKKRVNGKIVARDMTNEPYLITNWNQYVEQFGSFVSGAYLPQSVYGYFQNGGSRCYVISVKTMTKAKTPLLNTQGRPKLMVEANQAGLDGSLMRVRVEPVFSQLDTLQVEPVAPPPEGEKAKDDKSVSKQKKPEILPESFKVYVEKEGLSIDWEIEEVCNIRIIEDTETKNSAIQYMGEEPKLVSFDIPDVKAPLASLWPRKQEQRLHLESNKLPNEDLVDFSGDVAERTGVAGLERLEDVTIVCVPDLMTPVPGAIEPDLKMIKAVQTAMITHCEKMGDRVAILDVPPQMDTPQKVNNWRMNIANFDSSYAAMYYPWVKVMDPIQKREVDIPPSGYIAGVWARNDNTRGVHKAPANEIVRDTVGLSYQTTRGEQEVLNPNGINCIREFPGRGIRIWGARTLSSNPSWRYINVRRLFNYVKKSIENSTQWVVFEPNNQDLWARIRRDVTQFLRVVWSTGALYGLNEQEAFMVKCDEEINPRETQQLGQLYIQIAMAPVYPAEFVVFQIMQKTVETR